MKHIKKFGQINEDLNRPTEIRIERRGNNTYAFVKVSNGDDKNGEDMTLDPEQRGEIETFLNRRLSGAREYFIN